jgi:hypothetical protein
MELKTTQGATGCAATKNLPALLYSQEPSTGTFPETDQSSPYHPTLSLQQLS